MCPACRGSVQLLDWRQDETGRVVEGSLVCAEHGVTFKIVETIVVDQTRLDDALRDVADFWSHHPCMGKWEDEEKQYDGLRVFRYQTHPWLTTEVSEFTSHKADRVMEIGCSQGIDMAEFLRTGVKEYIGVDLSFQALLLARRRLQHYNYYSHQVTLLCSNAEDLPVRSGIVDYIYSYGVIHHSSRPRHAIQTIYRCLDKEGRFTVMYYYKYSLTTLIEGVAKVVNWVLVSVTRDKDMFRKICLKVPYRPEIGAYRAFLDTGYSAILHAPFAYTFSKRQSRRMFASFRLQSLKIYQLSPIVTPVISKLLGPRCVTVLAARIGWDLVIKGIKT